jgi:thiol-disulfide isomerase/thioredoxin
MPSALQRVAEKFEDKTMRLTISFLLLLLCLLPVAPPTTTRAAQDDIQSYTHTGQKMPAFSFTTLDGKQSSIGDLKGKVVFVNFWATWCPPCLAEMPRMEREVWRKFKASPDFFMVAIAREQTSEEIAPFLKENHLTFPVAPDPAREVFRLFGNGGIPRSYVVGRDGQILFQSVGYNGGEFEQLKKVLTKELSKGPQAQTGK